MQRRSGAATRRARTASAAGAPQAAFAAGAVALVARDAALGSPEGATTASGPFSDYRSEAPGVEHRITVADLPPPYATRSSANAASIVPRPDNAGPKAPAGFKVELFASGLSEPRVLRKAPNGDLFVAESGAGRIRV